MTVSVRLLALFGVLVSAGEKPTKAGFNHSNADNPEMMILLTTRQSLFPVFIVWLLHTNACLVWIA